MTFSDDVATLVAERKRGFAFFLGGMGSTRTNFYNDAYSRQGSAAMVRQRMRAWRDAGSVYPAGNTLAERLDTLGRAINLVRGISVEPD